MKIEFNNLYTRFVFTTQARQPLILKYTKRCSWGASLRLEPFFLIFLSPFHTFLQKQNKHHPVFLLGETFLNQGQKERTLLLSDYKARGANSNSHLSILRLGNAMRRFFHSIE